MSIPKVVEAAGHGPFYALVSVSLAVLLYPYYEWLLPFISTGLAGEVDSAILLLAATSVTSGLLYAVPLDQFIDIVIEYKAGHDSRPGRPRHIPVRTRNRELFQFVVRVDYLVSAWRAPSWLSSEDSCRHALSSSMDYPSIKKEIWSLKNRAAIGFAFLLWGPAVGRLGPDLSLLSVAAIVAGVILLLVPWMCSTSTRLPSIVRQVAATHYALDTMSTWRALGSEKNREELMSRLETDARQAEVLISDSQWDRLGRLYEWITGVLERHSTIDYEVEERLYEVWARAIVEITETRIRGERTDTLLTKYVSALEVFKKCKGSHLPQWAEQMTPDNLTSLPKLLAQPDVWRKVDPYYSTFHDVLPALFTKLGDERIKVSWLNALVGVPLSKTFLETLFRFACQYTDNDIVSSAYLMFAGNYDLPYEEVTVPFIDRLVGLAENPPPNVGTMPSRITNTLAWLARRSDVREDVRERIQYHAARSKDLAMYLTR